MSRDESRRSKRCRPDRDFELGPDARILMGDYDDERTLDEEEALEGSEDTFNELSHLQKESDMPLKDLLLKYGYNNMDFQDPNKAEDEEEEEEDEEDEEDDDEDEDDEDPATYEPDLKQFYTEMVKAEENGANVKRAAVKGADAARTDEPAALTPSINAHEAASNVETKVEGDSGVSSSGGASGSAPGDSQNPSGVVDANTGAENANSAAGTAPGTNVSSGGGSSSSRLLRSVSRPQSEEEEDDYDYSPDEEEWKKTIMVGSDYQAAIPEGLCKYDDALPYENEDKMLWDPSPITEEQVEEFLERAQQPAVKGVSLPSGSHVRDDEQALYLLLQCGYNLEEAHRRRKMNVLPSTESVSIWSEEECHNFESGIRNFGKDFYLIHKHKVRTRSVGELVQFYYLWKKTERHDIFTYKARMEKKKYALHPGVTDYMDRFLEEQEGVRDRSSSPNVNCLMMHGDNKRHRSNANSIGNEEPSGGANKANLDGWDSAGQLDVSANSSAATAATTASSTMSSTTTSSSSASTEAPTSVNSGPADPSLAPYHHHQHQQQQNHNNNNNNNSSASSANAATAAAASQLDYAKANSSSSAGVESSVPSAAAAPPWPSSNTSTSTTITPISSSSSTAAAPAPMLQQQPQQPPQNHLHMQQQQQQQTPPPLPQQQQVTTPPANKNNDNDAATLTRARTPENVVSHLPP